MKVGKCSLLFATDSGQWGTGVRPIMGAMLLGHKWSKQLVDVLMIFWWVGLI